MLLQRLQLSLFVMGAWDRWRHWGLPIIDERPIVPRRLLNTHCREILLAEATPPTSNAHRIIVVLSVVILRDGSYSSQGVHNSIPTVLHIGHAARERFFRGPRGPVIACGDPFVDEVFRSGLEEVDGVGR